MDLLVQWDNCNLFPIEINLFPDFSRNLEIWKNDEHCCPRIKPLVIFSEPFLMRTPLTLSGTSSFVWLPTWAAFASPTSMLRPRPRSEDPSSCSGPTRNGPSLVSLTFPCSASTRSLRSRWLKGTRVCCSAGRAATLPTRTYPNSTATRCTATPGSWVASTGALVTGWCRWCRFFQPWGFIFSFFTTQQCLCNSVKEQKVSQISLNMTQGDFQTSQYQSQETFAVFPTPSQARRPCKY